MIPPPAGLTPDDYDRIEEAVMETARGRWFLAEFARRVRAGDTQKILEAIHRLERASAPAQFEVAQEHARGIGERLMEIAFQLRARRVDDEVCRAVEREGSAAFALAGEERGPAFAKEFEAPRPEPKMIEATARHAPARESGLSPSQRAAFDKVATALSPAAEDSRGPTLEELERMPAARRLGFFA